MSPDLTIFLLSEICDVIIKAEDSTDQEVIDGFMKIASDNCDYLFANYTPTTDNIYPLITQMHNAGTDVWTVAQECLKLIPPTNQVSSEKIKFVLKQYIQIANTPRKFDNSNFNFIMFAETYSQANIANLFKSLTPDSSQFYKDMEVLGKWAESGIRPTSEFSPIVFVQKCLDEYQNGQAA